jgi:antitoxin (DNA-binding transcriptional repressor) of toxin-antitoxin stability system
MDRLECTVSNDSVVLACPERLATVEKLCLHSLKAMCHNVHMKTISIRELHLQTGRWVRHAASRGPIVVTDRGRRVAALQPFDASVTGRPLPNREAAIRKRSKVPVDSVVYQSELREDR